MDVFIRSLEDDVCAYPSRPLSVLYLNLQSYGWWSRPLSNNHPNHPSLPPDRTSWSSREHNGNSLQPLIAWAWKLHHYVKMGIVLLFLLFRPKIYRLMVKADITESWWIWGKTDGKRSSEKIPVMSSGCIWFRPLSSTGSLYERLSWKGAQRSKIWPLLGLPAEVVWCGHVIIGAWMRSHLKQAWVQFAEVCVVKLAHC